MNNYAVVKNGVVLNVAVWDGKSVWVDSGSAVAIPAGTIVNIGYAYASGVFTAPATD